MNLTILKACLVFAAQLLGWGLEKNWGLLVAALASYAAYGVIAPDAAVFHAIVLGPEGLHATGQQVFGVVTFR